MSERELLEAAARAAGIWVGDDTFADPIDRKYVPNLGLWVHVGDLDDIGHWWNPLHNGDHALRLAVRLRLDIYFETQFVRGEMIDIVEVFYNRDPDTGACQCEMHSLDGDPAATVRRCIVRAAAEIGRAEDGREA